MEIEKLLNCNILGVASGIEMRSGGGGGMLGNGPPMGMGGGMMGGNMPMGGPMGGGYNNMDRSYDNRGGMNRRGGGSVVMIYGINTDKMNCQAVFNLFCQYGNIVKVTFMKNKENCAMIEMGDYEAADRAIHNLNHTEMFGSKLRLDYSKKAFIEEVRNPHTMPDGSLSYQDFFRNRNNRFDTPERAAKNRIIAPTKILHFYNVPKMEEGQMEDIFSSRDAPLPARVKWLPGKSERSASGLLEFESVDEACEAMAICNHAQVEGSNEKRPYDMKLCFSPASH